jgi:hypothetical protein
MPPKKFCVNCGFEGVGIMIRPGSSGVEALLWLCLIIPGAAYSMYRSSQRYRGCPNCATLLIPIDSPRAQFLRKKFGLVS